MENACDGCKELESRIKSNERQYLPAIDVVYETKEALHQLKTSMALYKQQMTSLDRSLRTHMEKEEDAEIERAKVEAENKRKDRNERYTIAFFTISILIGFVVWTNSNITGLKVSVAKIHEHTEIHKDK